MKSLVLVLLLAANSAFADTSELDARIMQKVERDHQAEVKSGAFAQKKAAIRDKALAKQQQSATGNDKGRSIASVSDVQSPAALPGSVSMSHGAIAPVLSRPKPKVIPKP